MNLLINPNRSGKPLPGPKQLTQPVSPVQELKNAFKGRALLSPNPVLKSLFPVLQNSRFVQTDEARILEVAKSLAGKSLEPSNWKFPAFIQEDSEKTVQFFMIGNAINFKFWRMGASDRFETEYQGMKWDGATAMWACLRRAYEEGVPILDADYLSKLTIDQAKQIFRGNMEIPMLSQRVEILNEVGKVLKEKYGGSFCNLYKASKGYAFDRGNGMVERLVRDFPSFRDEVTVPVSQKPVKFYKRAQLAVAMLASRLKGTNLFQVKDLDNLTVFADYELPKTLNNLGILKYQPSLDYKINQGIPITKGSREEVEIRANTLYASALLELALKQLGKNVNALNVDYLLWSAGTSLKGKPHHLTETTAY